MASEIKNGSPEELPEYEQLWQDPEVGVMMQRHFMEQLQAGIFTAYNTDVARIILESEAYDDEEKLVQAVTTAELPLAIAADTGGDMESDEINTASPLGLVKVDPNTGNILYGSLLSVAQVEEGRITQINALTFTQAQAEILLRQGNEQIALGLHPELIFHARQIR